MKQAEKQLQFKGRSLREREWKVLVLVAKGFRNREIAEQLGVSPWVVKFVLSRLFIKFDVTTRTELVGLAAEFGVLEQALALWSREDTSGGSKSTSKL